ncbi:ABC transporter permease [Mycobacterium sp. M1]|uniref:ABC transporter permease n=1 Tax=Mycolicibacter acidiphilus TaxID=2835306 RepID=A0ABS5RG32_9MYCO|nr:ABC transporter permease [Mycolicibacter acidiphilus]MBS9533236.1 ABC transporter permease [Mycolicibacter acidiphilus]
MTAQDERDLVGEPPLDGVAAIEDWAVGYVKRHPMASLTTVGEQCILAVRTIQYFFADLFSGQFQWGEFVRQSAFMATTAVLPTVLVALPIGVTLSIQFALLANQVGATSMAGAAAGLAVIRQAASLVAAMLMAAAVGSAITADLGSRTMREETDAMEVMGVSVIRRLVVPRFGAAIMIGLALTGITCFVGFLASYLFNVYFQKGTPGSFVASFSSFATTGDMIVALLKAIVYGAIVAVVSCQKGLSTKGGPAGVANSVNASVVEAILVLMIVNVGISQLYNVLFPRTGL